MSLVHACSQYPISKRIIAYVKSLKDVISLITTSRTIYHNLYDTSVRKTFQSPSNILTIIHESCDINILGDFENINVGFDGVETTAQELYDLLSMYSDGFLEHIKTIRMVLNDSYTRYNQVTLTCFYNRFAVFIGELFDLCSNADTLELYSDSKEHYSIIENLKTPRIKVLKNTTLNSLTLYAQANEDTYHNLLNGLTELKEVHIVLTEDEIFRQVFNTKIFQIILKQLSMKDHSKIIISGQVHEEYIYIIKRFISLIQHYNVDVGLEGWFLCHKTFFDNNVIGTNNITLFPFQSIVELNVCLWTLRVFEAVFNGLLSLNKLKTLKIDLKEQLVYEIIRGETMDIYDRCFNSKLISNIPNIEEFFLRIDNWNGGIFKKSYEKSFPVKNNVTKKLLTNLRDNVKVLYLDGVPNLTNDLSEIISTNCPNIINMHIAPLDSIDSNFLKNIEKLEFLNFKGNYKLIVPKSVSMLIVHMEESEESEQIAMLSGDESWRYFRDMFNISFKVSLRNCNDGHFKYNVFFNNILEWNSYLKKMDIFRHIFNHENSRCIWIGNRIF
uniref:F-box domain-containing protein n=1 Tax=Parastrongyloides trichosuri TaxID=131310 RepID=A0A0N5A6P9_PARTI